MRVISVICAAVLLLQSGSAFTQQSGAGTSGQMKSALLASKGFKFEGDCNGGATYFGGQMVFSDKGDKLFVKIVGTAGTCDQEVELSGDKIQFKGCGGSPNYLFYDASNSKEPFRGRVGGDWCKYTLSPI